MVHPTRRRHQLRIIGGQWRSRKLAFPGVPGLRPTPDRVRETLFNWLQHVIEGANCLDLFAGSGLLGFEALSRGAARVVFVEQHHRAAAQLRHNAELLGAGNAEIVEADSLAWLKRPAEPFDVVFLDPPYRMNLLLPSCRLLEANGWLAEGAHIYLECQQTEELKELPAGWEVIRRKVAGDVAYHLAIRESTG